MVRMVLSIAAGRLARQVAWASILALLTVSDLRAGEPAGWYTRAAWAAAWAEWVYDPQLPTRPSGGRALRTVHDERSGLHAEFLEVATTEDSTPGAVPGERPAGALLVVIRGTELDQALASPAAAAADVRSFLGGGWSQWLSLRAELAGALTAGKYREVILVGHSLGGMVAQLAAADLSVRDPSLVITAWLFNSPGVVRVADAITPGYGQREFPRLALHHVVHAADPSAESRQFGGHHGQTQRLVVEAELAVPHSIAELSRHLATR